MADTKKWIGEKPSNIALIKYMGKKDVANNIPANTSLSWTLDHLKSRVELELCESKDQWQPLTSEFPFEMSQKGKDKFLNHLKRIKETYGVNENFVVRSCNDFPADCGIASSASSFAALTDAATQACEELSDKKLSVTEKALISAKGSGSSCRSFWSGLVEWSEHGLMPIETNLKNLWHFVVLVGDGPKAVSSSDAHKMVTSSLLFEGRIERTHKRLQECLLAMNSKNWQGLFEVVWQEFYDMHALFETAESPFGYFEPGTIELLKKVRSFWEQESDGPVTTMDAGPNVHLLWREDQKDLALRFFNENIKGQWTCLSNLGEVGVARV